MSKERADARLGRLLAIVPWVAAHDGPTVEEVCRRFGVEKKDLVADLNLLFMCGVYPFTPDVLIDVDFADGRVWIRMADYFRRPLRLNPQEALALSSAAQAYLTFPGTDPDGVLTSAVEKLHTVLGVGADDALEVELGDVAADLLDQLTTAANSKRKIRIDYYSFGRDGHSTRVIHPWRVFNSAGHWYVSGYCEMAQAERLFRVDRITDTDSTGEAFDDLSDKTAGERAESTFHPAPGDARYVLDLRPPVHWIAQQYPHESLEARPDGVLRVTLRSGQRAWLERLVLRAGPDLTVVEGDPGVASEAATRLLTRYRPATGVH